MKKNNKGFSLVELIIVIAIMAALVAILAPQYIKYVEKSRVQADETCASEILNACKIAASDPTVKLVTGTYTVVWSAAADNVTVNVPATSPADDGSFTTAVQGAVGKVPAIKSTTHAAANSNVYTVSVVVSGTGTTVSGLWG